MSLILVKSDSAPRAEVDDGMKRRRGGDGLLKCKQQAAEWEVTSAVHGTKSGDAGGWRLMVELLVKVDRGTVSAAHPSTEAEGDASGWKVTLSRAESPKFQGISDSEATGKIALDDPTSLQCRADATVVVLPLPSRKCTTPGHEPRPSF